MEVRKNVIAAVAAAVQLYMQTLQAEQQQFIAVEPRRAPEAPRPAFSPWTLSGRQAAMEMRRMWQMRLVR